MSKFNKYIIAWLLILIFSLTVKAETVNTEPNDGYRVLTLKVMTLNIHSGINWHNNFDLDGLVSFIREAAPDIIGLQEVDRVWSSMSSFKDLPNELTRRLQMYDSYSASLERNSGNFGNLVLSKYPITQVWTCPLPGSLEQRSFVFVRLMVQGVPVNFLTTHLGLSVNDRLRQAAAILDFTSQVTGPTIIAGDFNGGKDDPAVIDLHQNFIDFREPMDSKLSGTFRSKDGKLLSRIDYILVSPEFDYSKQQVVDNFVSDHLPLVAEINLQLSTISN